MVKEHPVCLTEPIAKPHHSKIPYILHPRISLHAIINKRRQNKWVIYLR